MSEPGGSDLNISLIRTRAVEKLIDTCAAGIGALYEPRRIVRRARAEAKASIIRAEAAVVAEGVAERARQRLRWHEERRQVNIDNVVGLASEYLPNDVLSEPVDPDWAVRFFQYSADVSNEEMQSLWASLLAGEVARPGTYSPRTLSVVHDMRAGDAQAFTKFGTFLWNVTNPKTSRIDFFPMLRTFEPDLISRADLTFDDLIQLDALGLIRRDSMQGFGFCLDDRQQIITYFDTKCRHGSLPENLEIDTGECVLTQAGQELAPIAGARPDREYCERVLKLWNATTL